MEENVGAPRQNENAGERKSNLSTSFMTWLTWCETKFGAKARKTNLEFHGQEGLKVLRQFPTN